MNEVVRQNNKFFVYIYIFGYVKMSYIIDPNGRNVLKEFQFMTKCPILFFGRGRGRRIT